VKELLELCDLLPEINPLDSAERDVSEQRGLNGSMKHIDLLNVM